MNKNPKIYSKQKEKPLENPTVLCVSIDLSYRAVASQVLSARVSLTSVFGMGTGGPSQLKTLTKYYGSDNVSASKPVKTAVFLASSQNTIRLMLVSWGTK